MVARAVVGQIAAGGVARARRRLTAKDFAGDFVRLSDLPAGESR